MAKGSTARFNVRAPPSPTECQGDPHQKRDTYRTKKTKGKRPPMYCTPIQGGEREKRKSTPGQHKKKMKIEGAAPKPSCSGCRWRKGFMFNLTNAFE